MPSASAILDFHSGQPRHLLINETVYAKTKKSKAIAILTAAAGKPEACATKSAKSNYTKSKKDTGLHRLRSDFTRTKGKGGQKNYCWSLGGNHNSIESTSLTAFETKVGFDKKRESAYL